VPARCSPTTPANSNGGRCRWWGAVPYGGKKRGADTGIDGHIYSTPDGKTTEKAIVSVKGGSNVNIGNDPRSRPRNRTGERKAGVFITLAKPTAPIRRESRRGGLLRDRVRQILEKSRS
jgi:hypothetical protein